MERSWKRMRTARGRGGKSPGSRTRTLVGIVALGLWVVLAGTTARAQAPQPFVPNISERSGLLMRFASTAEVLPPDPHRDNFYNTRYGDSGKVKHPNFVLTQGLYGLGWKTDHTESVYPYFYGMPGQSTVDSSSRHGWRPLRLFDNLAHPWRPVGMYYSMGSYVPIYDLDPLAPGPGPYPFPFYFNWLHGGWSIALMHAGRDRREAVARPCRSRNQANFIATVSRFGQRMSGERFSAASAMNA